MKWGAGAAINDTNTSYEFESDGSESVEKQRKKAEKIQRKRRSMYKSFLPLGLPTSSSRIGLRNEVKYHIVNTANVRSLVPSI